MDKINSVTGGQQTTTDQTRKASGQGRGPSFQEILDKAAAQVGETTPADVPAQQVGHTANAQPAGQVEEITSLTQTQAEGLAQAGRTLDKLDDYVAALGNGNRSLKDMAPLVSAMEEEAEGLARTMDQLDAKDELKAVLNDVAVTVMVESIKFNRGDYLPVEA